MTVVELFKRFTHLYRCRRCREPAFKLTREPDPKQPVDWSTFFTPKTHEQLRPGQKLLCGSCGAVIKRLEFSRIEKI